MVWDSGPFFGLGSLDQGSGGISVSVSSGDRTLYSIFFLRRAARHN
jgi:hypothetical protein